MYLHTKEELLVKLIILLQQILKEKQSINQVDEQLIFVLLGEQSSQSILFK